MAQTLRHALPAGYRLDEYEIDSVLGHGGFGVTYLAHDRNLGTRVALKEFLPGDLVVREDGQAVHPKSEADREEFLWGLDRFLQEAQTLARFKHPNIVPVLRFFEANGTAYLVMEYQEGKSLTELLEGAKRFTEAKLWPILVPLLDGLAEVHKAGFLHRDIKPGNIYVREDGSPVLLDFGAARQALGNKSKSLTAIVTAGYAPFEQYETTGNQGPWTDIYALGGVLYRAMTGAAPVEATARASKLIAGDADPLVPTAEAGKGQANPRVLAAIDTALSFREKDRPQSVEAWRDMLLAAGDAGSATVVAQPSGRSGRPVTAGLVGFAVALLIVGGGFAAWQVMQNSNGAENNAVANRAEAEISSTAPDNSGAEAKAEAKRKAEEEAKRKAEAESKQKADEEAKARAGAEAEAKRKAEAEAEAETERRVAEDAKRQKETEARIAELERRAQEAEKRAQAAVDAKTKPATAAPVQSARLPENLQAGRLGNLFSGARASFARQGRRGVLDFLFVFEPDGRLRGQWSANAAGDSDEGTWEVRGEKLCLQFKTWGKGRRRCYTITGEGRNFSAIGGGRFGGNFILEK